MFSHFSYQKDTLSSDSPNSLGLNEQEDTNGLQLLKEIDVAPKFLKPKKKITQIAVVDTLNQDTTAFYGIKNEEAFPVRSIDAQTKQEISVKTLFDPTPREVEVANWQTTILIFSLLLLGFAKAFSASRFKQTIKAIVNFSIAQEITREEKVFFHRVNILLTIIHVLIISLFIYQLKSIFYYSGEGFPPLVYYLFIIGFIIITYIIKYIFSWILFYVFDEMSISSDYIFSISLYNNLLGILLIPIICLTYYSSIDFNFILIYLALPAIFITFILRIIRLYSIGLIKGISFLYIILYICTLEIVPLVVLFRIFIHK